jgi:prevent-host-death family protein
MYVFTYGMVNMGSITITNARKDLYQIVESVNETHEPIEISGKKGNAVLVGEEDWRSISEPLSLMSEELDWQRVQPE